MYQSLCVGIDETSFCLMNVQNNMTLSCVLANARVTQLVRLWNSKGRIKFLCKRNKKCLLRRPSCSLCFSTSGIFLPRDHGVQSRRACSVIARLLATLDHLLKSKQYIPSEVGQGCRMCLLALSIMVRGAKNVNKRLFRSIEAVLSSYWLQLNGDIVASSLL